jgi:plastocyanin
MALTGAVAVAAAPAASAQHVMASGPTVDVGFDTFAPPAIDVLTGDTVTWMNDSSRQHTVTADDGSFDSGQIPVGGMYAQRFATPGTFAYHCSLHPFMTGAVAVHDLLLDRPAAPAGPGRPYPVRGRSALPAGTSVVVEADAGAGHEPAGTATVADDGSFATNIVPSSTSTLRAVANGESSPPVQLVVIDHTVTITVRRLKGHRVRVDTTVTPAAPGSTVVLQLRLRERFGWWPERALRLDARSHARFVIRSRSSPPARVALTLPDRSTVLATSSAKHHY